MGHSADDVAAIRAGARELSGAFGDFDVLLERIGDAGCVLLGESTHGTAQFYAVRAHITKRLVEERGFRAVAVEADGPDARRADAWVRGAGDDPDVTAALGDFVRFPRWLWRNREVAAFLGWLREHNAAGDDVGFHGLDLPAPGSWNLRERHMAATLDALRTHAATPTDGRRGKVVVWAHNAHAGDARATEAAELGQLSLGQLARDAYGDDDTVLVGLSTYEGAVTAAPGWGEPATTMRMAPAREDATEALLHATGPANLLLVTGADARVDAALRATRLQRAIGAIYRPETELVHHYVFADATRQFDALIHLDTTSALEPLDVPTIDTPRR